MPNIHAAYDAYLRLLALAEDYCERRRYDDSAALAQVAVNSLFPNHIGLFASPRLERLALRLGQSIPVDPSPRSVPAGDRQNVLHILTYARPLGGDTRFAWRWIRADRGNRHCVAITSQSHMAGVCEVPETLQGATADTGGWLHRIRASASRPLQQARELRRLCQGMDVILLHLWPYDIVPILALASGCDSAKTLFINLSDHTFWAGASVAHSVVHLRRQNDWFLRDRRCLAPSKSCIVPIPLDEPSASDVDAAARLQAKLALGYDQSQVILLTIATPFKYYPGAPVTFLQLVTPVLERFKNAVLIVVGPPCEGDWEAASSATEGRIIPLGTQRDTARLRAAADIYLDSFPFSSITSLLESGILGAPILAHAPSSPDLALLGPGAPGIEDIILLATSPDSYRESLARLISDPLYRREHSEKTRSRILSMHTGENWARAIQDAYSSADRADSRGCFLETTDNFAVTPLGSSLRQLYAHAIKPRHNFRMIRNYVGALSYPSRLSVTFELHKIGFDVSLLGLLPPPLNAIARTSGRYVLRLLRHARAHRHSIKYDKRSADAASTRAAKKVVI